MCKRLLTTLTVLAVLLAGGYLFLCWTAPRHNITLKAFDAIQEGMARAEVEAILRVPPGHYLVRSEPWFREQDRQPRPWMGPAEFWSVDAFAICVAFNDNGRVKDMWRAFI